MRFHGLVFGKTVFSNGRGCSVTQSFPIACISLVNEPDKYACTHAFPQVKYTCKRRRPYKLPALRRLRYARVIYGESC